MIVGNLVAGKRIAQASGRELTHLEDSDQARKVRGAPEPAGRLGGRGVLSLLPPQFLFLPDVLQWRAHTTPEHPLFLLLNAKVRAPARPRRAGEGRGRVPGPEEPAVLPRPLGGSVLSVEASAPTEDTQLCFCGSCI